jgi:DNA polymerase I-like protein with 3'-5' exonuclease and polymerase domains
MVSLDEIIERYGGRKKIDEVKLLWEAGVQTDQISEALLADYLLGTQEEGRNSGDIGNTEKIFRGQIVRAQKLGMIKMIEDRMDGLLCTTEMEFNGLKIDIENAKARLKVLTADLKEQTTVLQEYLPENLPWEFNWNSRTQVSALIFGGTVKYEVREPYQDETGTWVRYKAEESWPLFGGEPVNPAECSGCRDGIYYRATSLGREDQDTYKGGKQIGSGKYRKVPVQGELKIKWQDRHWKFDGYTIPKDEWKGAETDAAGDPIYSTSGDVIEELVARTNIPFLKAYDRKNELNKEIGTYYIVQTDKGEMKGMLTCVMPDDRMLHHKLNHTSTVTSRLSSNDPNLQNLPRVDMDKGGVAKSEVKRMFISRFGPKGRMVEIDYSQLEVVVQGVLTGDEQLCQDLRDMVDFHCKRVSAKHNITYAEAVSWCKDGASFPALEAKGLVGKGERTKCKIFSFQRAYGAGAAKIALTTGMPITEVEELIENEDLLYPGVVKFNDRVAATVNATAEPFNAFCDTQQRWRTFRKGYYTAPTGTRYCFRTFDAPAYLQKRGIDQTFSPTQLKNYPVQGTGGEFVQAILGRLFRHYAANDNFDGKGFLVNTVHDCVWADLHEDVVDQVVPEMIRIMESIPQYYNQRYNLNITVPFPVEAEIGLNMMDLEHYHIAA